MSGHSRLSPSHSSTWLNCPGALTLSEGMVDGGSTYASEGVDAHELGSLALTLDMEPHDFLDRVLPMGYTATQEMCDFVKQYTDYCRGLQGQHFVENRVDLTPFYGEEGGGTADFICAGPKVLEIVDLKYGKGVPVSAVENTQLRIYAVGALNYVRARHNDKYLPEKIRTTISQPRITTEPSTEELSFTELNEWARDVLIPGAKATRDPDAKRIPGDKQCRWCLAKGKCPELMALAAETVYGPPALVEEFEDLTVPPPPERLTDAHLTAVMDKAAMIEAWLQSVRAEAARRLNDGRNVAGYKLVRGRKGPKQWAAGQEEAVVSVLRNNFDLAPETIYKMELLSPTKILELPDVKKQPDLLAAFVTQSEGSISVAPVSDKRQAVEPHSLVAAEFSVIDEQE